MESHSIQHTGMSQFGTPCPVNIHDSERLLSMAAGGLLGGWGLRHLFSGHGLVALAAVPALFTAG